MREEKIKMCRQRPEDLRDGAGNFLVRLDFTYAFMFKKRVSCVKCKSHTFGSVQHIAYV